MRSSTKLLIAGIASLLLAFTAFPQGGAAPQQAQGQQQQQGKGNGQPQQQQNAPTGPPGVLTGNVVSSTSGEPLRKVTLSLRPQGRGGSPATATSDAAGNYRFAAVDPGTYTLTGERSGYVRAAYGEESTGQAKQITVASNQTTSSITVKLLPHSVILGKVFDQDGDPVQGAMVQVSRYSYPRGQRQLTGVDQATTNDIGEFRVPGLAPGRYYVSAAPNPLANLRGAIQDLAGGRAGNIDVQALQGAFGGQGGPGGGPGRGRAIDQILGRGAAVDPESYITTYFPRSADASAATPIDLVPGSEMRGVDIGLLKARMFTISGIVEGAPAIAAPLPDPNAQQQKGGGKNKQLKQGKNGFGGIVQVRLVPRTSQQQQGINNILNGQTQANADGSFEFKNIPPGAYYVMADFRGPQQQQDRLSARSPVDVGSSDLNGVRVRLQQQLDVAGKVAPEKADTTINFQNIRVNFTSATNTNGGGGGGRQGGGPGGQPRIDLAADGKFTTKLDADTYTVELQNAPSGYYLKAVKLAGREAQDNRLDLNFSGAQLEVVLANDSGSISGKVEKSNGDPVQNARVTVVPVNNSPRRDLYKSANSGTDGTFSVANLPPGSYKVFAWEEVETNAWMDADFRRPFESLGASSTIKDGSAPAVTLRLIDRQQLRLAGVQ